MYAHVAPGPSGSSMSPLRQSIAKAGLILLPLVEATLSNFEVVPEFGVICRTQNEGRKSALRITWFMD